MSEIHGENTTKKEIPAIDDEEMESIINAATETLEKNLESYRLAVTEAEDDGVESVIDFYVARVSAVQDELEKRKHKK